MARIAITVPDPMNPGKLKVVQVLSTDRAPVVGKGIGDDLSNGIVDEIVLSRPPRLAKFGKLSANIKGQSLDFDYAVTLKNP